MAIDFPNSPTIGDEYSAGGYVWTWSGSAWEKIEVAPAEGFALATKTSGNKTFTFDTDQPAGLYTLTSALNHTTFDIYLLDSADQLVASSSVLSIEAPAPFRKVVLYGALNNDVITFEYAQVIEAATTGEIGNGEIPPYVTTATPSTLESIDDTTTVTGGNFATNVTAKFIGQDAIDRAAKSVVRASSTQLIVTRPDVFPVAQEPFTLVVENPGTTEPSTDAHHLTNFFDAGGAVTWVTTSPLPNYSGVTNYSTTLVATDGDGLGVTYAVTSGTLPAGLTLNSSTGVISGTATGVTAFVTVTATDSGGNSSSRQFELPGKLQLSGGTVTTSGGYTYHTFTSSGTLTASGAGSAQVLVVAGGGGSWAGGSWSGGNGGGAGGLIDATTVNLSGGTYPIVIGAGGTGGKSADPTKGTDSTFNGTQLVALGGGAGLHSVQASRNGGSGAGGSGTGTTGQGNNGGPGDGTYGGSGGGKGGAGTQSYSGGQQAPGGAGTSAYSTWATATSTGSSGVFAAGGAGQRYDSGGGGNGPANSGFGASAGSGHGGAPGYAGGSGVVIVRYVA